MDWKLIFRLSLFGLAMGIATVFVIPPNIEPVCWVVIFLICGYVIAKQRPTGRFLHGLLLGLANSVWITAAHVLLFARYIAGHAQEANAMKSMPAGISPKTAMLVVGALSGIVFGVVIGLLALAAGKLIKRPVAPAVKAT